MSYKKTSPTHRQTADNSSTVKSNILQHFTFENTKRFKFILLAITAPSLRLQHVTLQ